MSKRPASVSMSNNFIDIEDNNMDDLPVIGSQSSVNTSISQRKLTSWVWKHFEGDRDKMLATCLTCRSKLSWKTGGGKGGTGHLIRHLRVHKISEHSGTDEGRGVQGLINTQTGLTFLFNEMRYRIETMKFVIGMSLPFSHCDGWRYVNWIQRFVNPRAKRIPRTTLRSDAYKYFKNERTIIGETLSPPPPPQPQSESESEDEGESDVVWGKIIRPGMYIDKEELTGTPLINLLEAMNLTLFASFQSHWYPQLVDQFYETFRRTQNGINFKVGNVRDVLTESDLVRAFNMRVDGTSDYPERKWSSNWPLEITNCVTLLNNGRRAKKSHLAYKYNLSGIQKLVFKVVHDILLPTNNQASELCFPHTFATCAILTGTSINWPLMILKHMDYQKAKRPYQYGMIISHLLVNYKGVPVGDSTKIKVKKETKIGTHSLISQELYMWENQLYAKWEIFENFSNVSHLVWRANKCPIPAPPKDWIPTATGHDDVNEPSFQEPSFQEPSFHGPPFHEHQLSPQFHPTGEGSSSAPPIDRMTDRYLMESMYNSMKDLRLDQQRMIDEQQRMMYEQQEYQWRHMSYMQAVGERLSLQDTYQFLFSGYPQPSHQHAQDNQDPMEEETQD